MRVRVRLRVTVMVGVSNARLELLVCHAGSQEHLRRQLGGNQPTGANPANFSAVKPANLRRRGATVRGTHGTPEAGTRRLDVQCVGLWGQAALRRYARNAGVALTCQLSRSTKRCQARSSAEGRLGSTSESDSGACART